jgi:hypothetical protein
MELTVGRYLQHCMASPPRTGNKIPRKYLRLFLFRAQFTSKYITETDKNNNDDYNTINNNNNKFAKN